jgi:hypothetical protein
VQNEMSAKGHKRTLPQHLWLLNTHSRVSCLKESDRRSCLHALLAKRLCIPFTAYDAV